MKTSLSKRQKELINATVGKLDASYDDKMQLLGRNIPSRGLVHDVRSSAYYALGLLARGDAGDAEIAEKVINRVLDEQLLFPGEIFHATFKRAPQEPTPPIGSFPWKRISNDARHFFDVYMERTTNAFLQSLVKDGMPQDEVLAMEKKLEEAHTSHFPEVWRTYDPNWREFIGSTFAIILDLYEDNLSEATVKRLEASMHETVNASIERRLADMYPMNTNVELMHIILCDYVGFRFDDRRVKDHADFYATDLYKRYMEFNTVAEFNSPTYYGVDLCALAQWRCCGKSKTVQDIGVRLEASLWRDMAQFYNAHLRNLAGPFTRNHEMNPGRHTALFALMHLGLVEHETEAVKTTEDVHNITMAICGVKIPDNVKDSFIHFTGERQITKHFRELIERGDPEYNNPLCTATAWIEKDLMLGGLSGSKNVSGQIHPATVYWKASSGTMSIRLLRREPGNDFGKGNRAVHYDARAEKGKLDIDVAIDIERGMELFFQIESNGNIVSPSMIKPGEWHLPGIIIKMDTNGGTPNVLETERGLEIVYLSKYENEKVRNLSFKMKFELANE